ncbi:MAG: ribosomal protein L7/L12 [Gemmataceae bacterium]
MSEEAAFLEALKANPADDTVRLVYADWLDEHAEPAKAEYLRHVATLALAEEEYAREQPHETRLFALAATLPTGWQAEVGHRFQVIFYGCPQPGKVISIIKAVRTVTGFGLGQARDAVIASSCVLLKGVTFDQALLARDAIREAGGTVYLHPCERSDRPVTVFYNLIATRWPTEPMPATQAAECKAAFAMFLQRAMNLGAVEARRLAKNDRVTLEQRLSLASAEARAQTLRQHINVMGEASDIPIPWEMAIEQTPESTMAWGISVQLVPIPAALYDTP